MEPLFNGWNGWHTIVAVALGTFLVLLAGLFSTLDDVVETWKREIEERRKAE